MKKLIVLLCVLSISVCTAWAVPAKRGIIKTMTLPDGTRVEAELRGDEHVNYYETVDGRALQKIDGSYQFVDFEQLRASRRRNVAIRNQERSIMAQPRRVAYSGQKKGLVILVNFTDVKFTYTQEDMNKFFNEEGFNLCGMSGSVHDYFLAQSYGKFDLEFDVVGPVTVSHDEAYYAQQKTYPKRVPDMIYEACQKADSQVDFRKYDWDGDKMVDQVFVVCAGYSAAQGAEDAIWPHEWSLYAGSRATPYTTGENVKVATYGISCELRGDGKENTGLLDGIGTACHEFSHCLGLPDFYDTREDGTNFGMSVWSLMDYGCYNDNGRTPCGYTAYERWISGWLEPVEIKTARQVTNMPAIEDEPVAYIMYNDANQNEYYLLANHQQKGFDAKQYGHGLLVTHVDYNANAWSANTVNNDENHQRMTIIPADGSKDSKTSTNLLGDPYPGGGKTKNRKLTDTSTPAAALYNANVDGRKFMGKPITDITEVNGLITFNVMGGVEIDVPEVAAATKVSASGFTANWAPVDGATSYTIALTTTKETSDAPMDNIIMREEFTNCYTWKSSTSNDVSSSLNNYTDNSGWTGSKLYRSPYYLRIGSTQSGGTLISPVLAAPKRGCATLLISLLNAGSSTGSAKLYVIDPETSMGGSTSIEDIPAASSTTYPATLLLPLSNWNSPLQVTLQSSSPGVYVSLVMVLDGVYKWDDFDEAPAAKAPRRTTEVVTSYYTTSTTSYEFKDLEPAVYSYKVRATTSNGNSDWSEDVTVDLVTAVGQISDASLSLKRSDALYDATGRLVSRPTKGVYIRNGRKILVK